MRAALGRAQTMGIRAVPTFVIDGRQGIQGAHPPEALADVLRELAPPRPAEDEAAACGPDGCDA